MKYTISFHHYSNICGCSSQEDIELTDAVTNSPIITNISDTIGKSIRSLKSNMSKSCFKHAMKDFHLFTTAENFINTFSTDETFYQFAYSITDTTLKIRTADDYSDHTYVWTITEYADNAHIVFIPVAEFRTPYKYNYTVCKLLSTEQFDTFEAASACVEQFRKTVENHLDATCRNSLVTTCIRICSDEILQSDWYKDNLRLTSVLKSDPDSWFRSCGFATTHQLYELFGQQVQSC